MPPIWIVICSISLPIAIVAEVANRRRIKRTDINRVGFMPWQTIAAMAFLAFGLSLAFGLGFLSTR